MSHRVSVVPSIDQVRQLPAVREGVVPPEYLDENDHMNIGRYLEEAGKGLWTRTIELGMGPAYLEQRRLTTFTAEHHIVYRSELRLGDHITVHPRFLARSAKAFHSITFVVDRTHERVAAWCEAVNVHVGLDTRRPEPFPADIADALDEEVAAHDLGWPAPVSGSMGVRR